MDYNTASPMGKPPQLGTPIPGTTGGLPMQGGLNVTQNPMAQQLQSMGRGDDKMLVHMTPDEVNSLQGLAMATGGSLTINPETGLPEAGWLGKLLPTILGAIATPLTGGLINPFTASAIIGAGTGIATGSLKKGLMAGLQAYGGAALGSAAGLNAGSFGIGQAANAANAAGAAGAGAGGFGSSANLAREVTANAARTAGSAIGTPALAVTNGAIGSSTNLTGLASNVAGTAGTTAAKTGLAGFAQNFGNAARAGLPAGTPSFIANRAPMIAGMGVMSGVSGAMTPSGGGTMGSDGVVDNSYAGPYYSPKREAKFADNTDEILGSSKERTYFTPGIQEVFNTSGQLVRPGSSTVRGTPIMQNIVNPNAKKGQNRYSQSFIPYMGGVDPEEENAGYAVGGRVNMRDGSFVVDARTVSELGNGSSNAGMEFLSRMGGRPLQGPGDGVSDSIRASIGGKQEARVARDEVLFPPEAVKRLGRGSAKRGTAKLYSLMDKAHKARKKAKRGQDTKLRRGLA
jgi:hypothetical protein